MMQKSWSRYCPSCDELIIYNKQSSFSNANKRNSNCMKCRNKNLVGDKNPFFGKTHSIETIKKISRIDKSYCKTNEFKNKISKINKNNPNHWMKYKTCKQMLIDKHGEIEGNIKYNSILEKRKTNSSGQNNPMYGKATPKKAGNGWQGWYNNQFFRSLRELSYIINVLEKEALEWKSAENIRIPYINYDGNERTYSPDFLVDNKYLIEIKPTKLHNTTLIKLKTEAAIKYCNENGLEFKMIDQEIIKIEYLEILIASEKIKLTEKTKEKLVKWKKENSISA